MKVIAPGDVEIDLGITETTPTIGMIDYSRRVTDDFGVTTVVPRAFARRMSVRFALPSSTVDQVQSVLAGLRATSAQWVAAENYAWLNFEGFFKDFSIDVVNGEKSFCTLEVEGLAEAEAIADAGEDAAPAGRASTFHLLDPVAITDAMLTATNIAEAEWPEWAPALTYGLGDRVLKTSTHRVYESAIDGNTGNDPESLSGQWIDIGPTRRWAMFDQALGTASFRFDSIVVTLEPGAVDAVALLDVAGASVRVQTTGYDETKAVTAGTISFLDLPGVDAPITVTILGAGTVSVGTLLVGSLSTLGITGDAPTAGIIDFSRKEVDDFGEVTIVERAWSKRMSARTLISTGAVDLVANRIAAVRARPSLWIADGGTDALTIYGFFKDFSIEVGENVSTLSLSVEGLSEAAPVSTGLPPVNWPDVVDSDPAQPKPDDGATVGAPVGTPVGDRPAEQVNAEIDEALAKANDLYETYGDTAAASISAGLAADARDEALAAAAAADGYAETTQTLRDEAQGFAGAAHAEALTAGDAALASQASAVASSGHESSSATSANLSAEYSSRARLIVASRLPSTFENDGAYWVRANYQNAPDTKTPMANPDGGWSFETVSGVGRVLQMAEAAAEDVSSVGVLPVEAGRIYKLSLRHRTLSGERGGSIYMIGLNSSYAYVPVPGNSISYYATTSWATTSFTMSGDDLIAAGIAFLRAYVATTASSDILQFSSLKLEDVTESTIAGNQAGIATTQAAAATAAASVASQSETLTAIYRADALKIAGNFGFELGKDNWFEDQDAVTHPLQNHPDSAIVTGANAYFGKDLRQGVNKQLTIFSGTMIPVDTSRKYRIWTQLAAWSPVGTGPTSTVYVGFVGLDADGNIQDHGSYGSYRYCTAPGVSLSHSQTYEPSAIVTGEGNDSWVKFPPGTKFIRPMAILNYLSANIYTYIGGIFVEDVTERVASETQAGIATSQAAIATSEAAAAKQSSELSASLGRGTVNPNSNFANYPTDGVPPDWANWSIAGGTHRRLSMAQMGLTGNQRPENSDWLYAPIVPSSSDNVGLQTNLTPISPGSYMVEATAQLMDGTYTGAGVLVYMFDAASNYQGQIQLRFWEDPDLFGTVGNGGFVIRRWSKSFTTLSNTAFIRLYAMANYNGFGGAMASKVLGFYKVGFKSGDAIGATVATQAAVLATHDTKLASWLQRVSAGPGYAQIKMTALDSNGATATVIDMAADRITLGLTTVLEVVAGKVTVNGDLYVQNGKIVVDTGTHMKVIGNGFGSASQFVEWFGPKMAINLCSEANAITYVRKDGQVYNSGSFVSGALSNSGATSGLSTTQTALVGPFGTNGNPIVVAVSWFYRTEIVKSYPATVAGRNSFDADVATYGATNQGGAFYSGQTTAARPSSTLQLERQIAPGALTFVTQGATTVETLTFSGERPTTSGDPGDATTATIVQYAAISFTYTDNAGGTGNRTFRAVLSRGFSYGSGTVSQRISMVTSEA